MSHTRTQPIAAGDAVGLPGFGPAFQRRWSPYLACFEAGFRAGYLDVHQLLPAWLVTGSPSARPQVAPDGARRRRRTLR